LFDFHPEDLVKILGQKSIDWAYEEEVRFFKNISSLPSYESDENDKNHKNHPVYEIKLVDIPPDAITGIYLGANMNNKVQQEIIKSCQLNGLNIPIYKASLSVDSYSLGFSLV